MQASLPHDLVPLGSSTLLSIISASCAIFMAIAQAVFQKQLQSNLGSLLSMDGIHQILDSGVTELSSLVSVGALPEVVKQYSLSVTQVFVSACHLLKKKKELNPNVFFLFNVFNLLFSWALLIVV